MPDASPSFDVVLFGPTGVTGREVARYLHQRAPELGLTWAVAGRDRARVQESLDRVGAEPAEVLVADATDPASIEAMVAGTRVVADLVGPFTRYGEPVYEACARLGRHCVDPTGETAWVRQMIDRYDDLATGSGAVLVPTAGFEALPFDLGTLYAAQQLHERTGAPVVSADVAVSIDGDVPVRGITDVVSGGTFASGVEMVRHGGSQVADPHLLDTTQHAPGRYDLRPRKHAGTGEWLSPMFPLPFLNPTVVHRTASLLRDSGDSIHAPGFEYREGTVTSSTVPRPAAPVAAIVLALASTAMGLVNRAPQRLRDGIAGVMERVGPSPGDGPRPEDLDRWRYRLDIRVTDATGATLDAVVEGDGHPGYKSTSTMLGEAALCLADPDAPIPDGAGFLTPATALGLAVLDRFERAGLRFRPAG
jgi:short subunit dehydrogenase-like uncharacterized protein